MRKNRPKKIPRPHLLTAQVWTDGTDKDMNSIRYYKKYIDNTPMYKCNLGTYVKLFQTKFYCIIIGDCFMAHDNYFW